MNNYNLKIIKEFKLGEYNIPFLFSLDKILAFPEKRPIFIGQKDDFSSKFVMSEIQTKLFECFYSDGMPLILDEDIELSMLDEYVESTDYIINKNNIYIKSKNLFFAFLHWIPEFEIYHITLMSEFKDNNYIQLMNAFRNAIVEDLEYYLDDKMEGNNSTHFLQWALGETSTNPNPFFSENLGKATMDWSWREIELRNLYKSKTFKIENAINKEKNRLEKKAMDEAKIGKKK